MTIKFKVGDVLICNDSSGKAERLLDLPILQVDRINSQGMIRFRGSRGYFGSSRFSLHKDLDCKPKTKVENPKQAFGETKLKVWLIPPSFQIEVAKALQFGAERGGPEGTGYGYFNWRLAGINITTYISAMHRHLMCIQDGEDIDPTSGVSHAAHIAAGAAVIIDATSLGLVTDDRVHIGAGPRMLRSFRFSAR